MDCREKNDPGFSNLGENLDRSFRTWERIWIGVFELGIADIELEREDDRNLIGGTAARPARSVGRAAVAAVTRRDQREGFKTRVVARKNLSPFEQVSLTSAGT